MKVVLPKPGSYVVAVSGGVDSVALLCALHGAVRSAPNEPWKLIVAHYDHGIREDSAQDREFVQKLARQRGLPFVYDVGKLGPGASEAAAREARYHFLRQVHKASGARAIITAHHQDDVLETAIINILRGSGRKGLTSLGSHHDIDRPLLHAPKQDIIAYANQQGLQWREDSTNRDETYLRNYVRRRILPKFDESARARLYQLIDDSRELNREIDMLLTSFLHTQSAGGTIDRQQFNHLPHTVSREVLAAWLRAHGVGNFDSKLLERLVVAAKTAQASSKFDILQSVILEVSNDSLALSNRER